MTTDRQGRVRELFDAALDQPADVRHKFLAEACSGDEELFETVSKLLRANERSAGILDTPIHERLETPPVEREPGSFIGAYKILHELPGGGMGVVYQAIRADEVFQRVCAVKVIRAEVSNSWMLERFRKERQILAQLDHVHIARIVDGGSTPDALPYFVMDYVDGPSIDKYCAQHKLSYRQRLVLFQQACAAVHYAHQKGVIHGDLKPPNVLVGSDGVVKLVDFGIATVLASSPENASENAGVKALPLMTPGYASPEQLRGDPLTPVSDVYSLGVILYELLSGARPVVTEGRSRSEVLEAIVTGKPKPPSTAARTAANLGVSADGLKGDLDWVILKAVSGDPKRRYQSAAEFSEDVSRYFEQRPVKARSKGLVYRGTKLFSRHWRAGIAAMVIACLFAALAWQGWELRKRYQQAMHFQDEIRSLQAQQVASLREFKAQLANATPAAAKSTDTKQLRHSQLNATRKLAKAYRTSFSESVRLWPGMTPARRDLLDQADEFLRQAEPLVSEEPGSAEDLATAWLWLANIEGNPQTINLHDVTGARISIDEANRLLATLPGASPRLIEEVQSAAQQIDAVKN